MKNLIILCLCWYIFGTNAFNCPNSTGKYGNSDNYQSFYDCNNYCPRLKYCTSPNPYFSNDIQGCSSEPKNWIPRYYLTGIELSTDGSGSTVYVRQDGYKLSWTYDISKASHTFTGQYINEIHVRGIHIRRVLTTNCISVFNVAVIAMADRSFCATSSLHPQSATCDLFYPYDYNSCRKLSL
jgi:hypothetical protein